MKVKRSKCEFHQSEPEYLGVIIGQERVKTDPVKIQAIWDCTTPRKIKEIQCFLRFCNFYQRFIEGFQQNSRTTIRKDKKRMHRPVTVGRQGTKSIRQTKDKAHQSTSTGLLRPPGTNQDRNRGLKICLLPHTISTMPGREMETSGIPIQDNVESRMQ